jgi:hypothetical protein
VAGKERIKLFGDLRACVMRDCCGLGNPERVSSFGAKRHYADGRPEIMEG